MRKNYKRLIGTVCGTVMLCATIGFTAFADKSDEVEAGGIPVATESTASSGTTTSQSNTEEVTNTTDSGEAELKEVEVTMPEETETEEQKEDIPVNKTLSDIQSAVYAKSDLYVNLLEETPLFIPVTNPHWVSGQTGMAAWDELEPEQQQNVKGIFLVIYKDGEKVGQRNANVGYAASIKLLESFNGDGSYQFKAVYRMTDQFDGEEDYLSDLSDIFEYTLPGKTMPIPTGYHWNKDGSVTWNPINVSDLPGWDTNSYITYSVSFYEEDADKPWDTWFLNSAPSIRQILKMEPGKTYRFRISATGDGLNYDNGQLSDFSEPFIMPVSESTVKVKLDALSQVMEAKLSETIKGLTLTDEERETMKTAVQNNVSSAEQLKELENRYKAASGKDFSVQAENNIVDSSQVNIAGAVLNDASKIMFTPAQSADSTLNQYRNQISMNISLDTSELMFPVLITMPAPNNMDVGKVKIYHYQESGSTEIIIPRIVIDNGARKLEFAVSGFSVFTFVDTSSATTSSNNSASGGSSSGGSSSGGFKSGKKSVSSIPETPGQWNQTEKGWQFKKSDGDLYVNTWVLAKEKWYWLEPDGFMAQGWKELNSKKYYLMPVTGEMQTGWILDDQTWYYADETGAMQTGWVSVGGKWYYLEADGHMLSSATTPDGYRVDESGIWIQ